MLSKTLSKMIVYFTRRSGHRHPVIYPCIIILCALMLTLQPTVTATLQRTGCRRLSCSLTTVRPFRLTVSLR